MLTEFQDAVDRWHSQVQRHHSQSIAAQQNFDPNQDFWEGMAQNFRDDPFRKGDQEGFQDFRLSLVKRFFRFEW